MSAKALAEAIILQSLEDLFDSRQRHDSVEFFTSDDFLTVAKLAGMSVEDNIRIMDIIKKINADFRKPNYTGYPQFEDINIDANCADRAISSPHALSAPPQILRSISL